MTLDEFIYDPNGSENSAGFNLVEGSFVFIAGEVAGSGGIDVNTPTSTLGIRGTTVRVDIGLKDGILQVNVALKFDPDGGLGSVIITDLNPLKTKCLQ